MTSRERVQMALNFKEPDRVPIDLGGMRSSGIMASAYAGLKNYLSIRNGRIRIPAVWSMLAEVEDSIRNRFAVDIIPLEARPNIWSKKEYVNRWIPWNLFDGTEVEIPEGTRLLPAEDGGWYILDENDKPCGKMPKDGFYFDALPEDVLCSPPKVSEYNPSCTLTDEELMYLEKRGRWLYENTDYAILGWGYGVRGLLSMTLPGVNWLDWLCMLYTEKNYCHDIMNKEVDAFIERMKMVNQSVGDYCAAWGIASDDAGTQRSEFISPEVWEEMIAPHYKRLCSWIHEHTKIKTFFHCCGSVYNLIPHFIECGIDILNPVQTSAENMEPERLKREFGSKIVFWGGGCDTQKVLPFGTADDVNQHVKERIPAFAPGGGFVFTQIHNIQQNVPPQNIAAMFEAAVKYGKY